MIMQKKLEKSELNVHLSHYKLQHEELQHTCICTLLFSYHVWYPPLWRDHLVFSLAEQITPRGLWLGFSAS